MSKIQKSQKLPLNLFIMTGQLNKKWIDILFTYNNETMKYHSDCLLNFVIFYYSKQISLFP